LSLSGIATAANGHALHVDVKGEAKVRSAKPTLAVGAALDAEGRLWLARVEKQRLLVSRSEDGGKRFSNPVTVTPEPEIIAADGENRPRIAVARDGTVLLVWAQSLPQRFTANIRFSRSTDGGKTFSTPVTLNDDGRIGGHSFASMSLDGAGRVAIVWLDGRDRDAARDQGGKFAGSSVYMALSNDNGASFSANRALTRHTCECCRTALAWTPQGPVAFWRNLYDGSIRDFALAYLDDGLVKRASEDEWRIEACPHHGGDIASDAHGRLHLTWFTNGATRQGLFYKRVEEGGESVALAFGDAAAQAGHPAVAVAGSTVVLTWREFDGRAYSAMAMRSDDGGIAWSPPHRLAESAGAADYPLPLSDGTHVRVLWNSTSEGLRVLSLDPAGGVAK
jgi:hypothetical protein